MLVKLPDYTWFVNTAGERPVTNDYTGSVGTSPKQGCVSQTTLSYRVWVKNIGEENARILAEEWLCPPWGSGESRTSLSKAEFGAAEEDLQRAEEWLNKTLEQHIQKLKERGAWKSE